jgi:hypothetical protein
MLPRYIWLVLQLDSLLYAMSITLYNLHLPIFISEVRIIDLEKL